MSIKLIAIDIDGTLINDQLEITEKTKEPCKKPPPKASRWFCVRGGP